MTLYEMNQIAYNKLPKMPKAEIRRATEKLEQFLTEHDSKYYMMLNVDGRYYTVYTYNQEHDVKKMAFEMIDVAKTLGILKGIEVQDDMVEFWIQQDKTCSMYAMFDYTQGVIEV